MTDELNQYIDMETYDVVPGSKYRELKEQYQTLRDLIDGAGVSFEDSRLSYIEIQVDRDAFLALRPNAIPAGMSDAELLRRVKKHTTASPPASEPPYDERASELDVPAAEMGWTGAPNQDPASEPKP